MARPSKGRLGRGCLLAGVLALPLVCQAALRVAVVADAVSKDYRQTVEAAVEEVLHRMGRVEGDSEIFWRMPEREGDRQEQARLLGSAVAERFDAVLLAPIDRQALAPALDAALNADAKVVCFGGTVDSWLMPPAVIADNRGLGRAAARALAARINARGRVILLRRQIHASSAEQREEGFIEVVTREFPAITLVATDYHAGPSAVSAQRVMTTLLERYGRDVQGIFISTEVSATGALAALRDAGLAGGRIQVVTVDEGHGRIRAALANGEVQALVTEDLSSLVRGATRLALGLESAVSASHRWVLAASETGGAGVHPEDGPPWPQLPQIPCISSSRVTTGRVVPDLDLGLVEIAAGHLLRRHEGGAETTVDISQPFWLGRHEVTQRQWMLLMDGNPADFSAPCLPVDNVSWNDAADFCRRLTAREKQAGRLPAGYVYALPSEAQWEYACEAGAGSAGISTDNGWCRTNSGQAHASPAGWRMSTHPVGTLRPNAWGLYDMLGNVAEWCADWSDRYPSRPAVDYTGPATGTHRALRGGSWWSDPQNCRSDHRHRAPPDRRHSGLGFRVALVPTPSSSSL